MKVIITKLEGNEVNQVEGVGTAEECIELARQIDGKKFAQQSDTRAAVADIVIPTTKLEELFAEVEQELIGNGLIPALQPKTEKNPAIENETEKVAEYKLPFNPSELNSEKPNLQEEAQPAPQENNTPQEQVPAGDSCDDAEDEWTEVRRWMLQKGYSGEAIHKVVVECKQNKVTPERALEALKWEK